MARRPLVLFGKYRGSASGRIDITGITGTGRFQQTVQVRPESQRADNTALRWLWARNRVAVLDDERQMAGNQNAEPAITSLGLEYSLLTAFTSFVAVDSQVVNLKSSGAAALFIAGTPKFAAQAIRKAAEIGWKAKIIINFPSGSIGGTLKPAGLENSVGVIVGTINKDPTDSKWSGDEGVQAYKAFFAKYLQGADFENTSYLTGYMQGMILERVLKQCGDDLSRKNIVKQAKSLSHVVLPTAFPGVEVNTSGSSNMIWSQMQLQRWSGSSWEPFGGVLDASSE